MLLAALLFVYFLVFFILIFIFNIDQPEVFHMCKEYKRKSMFRSKKTKTPWISPNSELFNI